jgi:hypothetical protein
MADSNTSCRAPIKGTLRLTRVQEDRLLQQAILMRGQALQAMGFLASGDGIYGGWLNTRKEAWDSYHNDFEFRRNGRFSALFRLFNSSTNIPKRAIRMFKARANDAVLGAQPVVDLEPEGDEDADPAIKHGARYYNRKLQDTKAIDAIREGIEQAAVSGEAVMKIARNPAKLGKPFGRVWVTGGAPVFDQATQQEIMEPEQVITDDEGVPVSEHDSWEPDADIAGQERLAAKPHVKKPVGARLSEDTRPLPQKAGWSELNISVLPYQDFIINPQAPSIDRADYCEHSFEWEEGVLRDYLQGSGANLGSPEVVDWLRMVHNGEKKPKVESQVPRPAQGEQHNLQHGAIPRVLMGESWMRFDLNDNGEHIIEVCLLWDVENEFPLGYDFMSVATSLDNERPFKAIRIIPSKNRWCGIGLYEFLSNEAGFIDRQWNRIDSRSGTSGTFKWMRKGAIEEFDRGIPIELNSNRIYTISSSVEDPKTAFGFTEFPEMDQNIWSMLQQMIQFAQTMTGTTQPTDAASSDLNQSDTLGEQQLLNQESDVINGDIMEDLKVGVTDTLRAGCYVVFAKTITEQDANLLLGAERAGQLLTWLPGKVQYLTYYLRLTLKKQANRQQMLAYEQAYAKLVGEVPYFDLAELRPHIAERVQPLIEGLMNANNIPGVEKMMKPLPMPPALPGNPNAPASTSPLPPAPALPAAA